MYQHASDDRDRTAAPRVQRLVTANPMLRLQASAGNRAVASLFVQRDAELSLADAGYSPADIADNELPEAVAGRADGGGPAAVEPEAGVQALSADAAVQRDAVVQRVAHKCPAYDGYSAPVALDSYNCSGLAHRSYTYNGLSTAKSLLSGHAASSFTEGQIKHWFWEYDLHAEDNTGAKSPANPDFHTVAGEVGVGGADPSDVFSKNGKRPVIGPGSGPGFKPAARERAQENTPQAKPAVAPNGGPLFVVRENIKESTYALSCPSTNAPLQGPPAP